MGFRRARAPRMSTSAHGRQTLAINLKRWEQLDLKAAKAEGARASGQLQGKLAVMERRLETDGLQRFDPGKTPTAPSAPRHGSRAKCGTHARDCNVRVQVRPAGTATLSAASDCRATHSRASAFPGQGRDGDVAGGERMDEVDEVQLCEALAKSKAALLAQIDVALQRPTRLDNGMDMVVTNFLAARRELPKPKIDAGAVPNLWGPGRGNSGAQHGNTLAPELVLGTARDSKGRALPQPNITAHAAPS